jgi:hypothetical protein
VSTRGVQLELLIFGGDCVGRDAALLLRLGQVLLCCSSNVCGGCLRASPAVEFILCPLFALSSSRLVLVFCLLLRLSVLSKKKKF